MAKKSEKRLTTAKAGKHKRQSTTDNRRKRGVTRKALSMPSLSSCLLLLLTSNPAFLGCKIGTGVKSEKENG